MTRVGTTEKEASLQRLETFSDGIFAFAITLLILQITIPKVAELSHGSLWRSLYEQWPSFLSYVLSFITIGIIWANHTDMFRHIHRSDHTFRMLNIFFLMSVAFIPFPTALLGEYLKNPANRQVAASIYTGTMVVFAIMYSLVWRYAATNKRLVNERLSARFLIRMTRRFWFGASMYFAAFIASFFSVPLSIGIVILITAVYFLPQRIEIE